MNNYDKMHSIEQTLDYISNVISGKGNDVQDAVPVIEDEVSSTSTGIEMVEGNVEKAPELPESSEMSDVPESSDSSDQEITESSVSEAESAVTEEPAEEAVHTEQYYIVQKGDTLTSISMKIYQTTDKIEEIKQLNGIVNGDRILEGEKILLP